MAPRSYRPKEAYLLIIPLNARVYEMRALIEDAPEREGEHRLAAGCAQGVGGGIEGTGASGASRMAAAMLAKRCARVSAR